jgi:hypothetical protein
MSVARRADDASADPPGEALTWWEGVLKILQNTAYDPTVVDRGATRRNAHPGSGTA